MNLHTGLNVSELYKSVLNKLPECNFQTKQVALQDSPIAYQIHLP